MPLSGGIEGHRAVMGWRVHVTKHQPDPHADEMSYLPAVVPLLTTRCLYQGWGMSVGLTGVFGGQQGV